MIAPWIVPDYSPPPEAAPEIQAYSDKVKKIKGSSNLPLSSVPMSETDESKIRNIFSDEFDDDDTDDPPLGLFRDSDDGEHIPPEAADVHRELSRAAHELAATAQALAMHRLGQGSSDSVGRHAERTLAHLDRAEELAARL